MEVLRWRHFCIREAPCTAATAPWTLCGGVLLSDVCEDRVLDGPASDKRAPSKGGGASLHHEKPKRGKVPAGLFLVLWGTHPKLVLQCKIGIRNTGSHDVSLIQSAKAQG